jgi:5-methylcytosine-specific restriction endonuclease McrA
MKVNLDEPVLVLNGNFEPLNVCSTRRALGLLFGGKAVIVEDGRGMISSVSNSYPLPSIIRINYVVQRPRPRLRPTRREIFRRDGYRCQYCGRSTSRLTIDHVLPRNRGGQNTWENLTTACPDCNVRKGERTPREAGMKMLSEPREPRPTALYHFGRYLRQHQNWRTYLEGW